MYLKKKKEPNGDIYLSIMEKYYDSQKKIARERTVEGIGHVSELKKNTMTLLPTLPSTQRNSLSRRKKKRH